MKKIAVIGVGSTAYGELWHKSLSDLLTESSWAALDDAGIAPGSVDAIVTGNMAAGRLLGQANLGILAANVIGRNVPSLTVEGSCASGALAVQVGIAKILAGQAQVVLVNGVEKLTDADRGAVVAALTGAGSMADEGVFGATNPALFALVARAYLHQWGIDRRQLAAVSVKNHRHAKANPLAHLRKEITVEEVLKAPMVADPFSLLDCAPISDGAASVVLASMEAARAMGRDEIAIIGYGQGVDTLALGARDPLIAFKATQTAAAAAFAMAGITPEVVDVAEVHDAFSLAEIMALEDMGFFTPGTAGQATVDGKTTFGGQLVVNPSGGLKAKGHPVGATGVGQVVEVVQQLRGQCGQRQVAGAKLGLTHSMGGVGATAVVHLLARKA